MLGLGNAFINIKYSQKQEMEADEYGLEFLKVTGGDVKAAASALAKISDPEAESLLDAFFGTHPAMRRRIEKLKELEDKSGGKSAP